MEDPILLAIPFFVLFMAVEVFVLRHAAHEHAADPSTPVGYAGKDTATSITMSMKLVPQRGCRRLKRDAFSGVSGSPAS